MVYLPNEQGQCLVEVVFIALFGAIVTIILLALTGPAIGNVFTNIVTPFDTLLRLS